MGYVLDPATGKPTFNNTPSTVSDLQAAADYATRIGDSSVATVADLEDIEYPREGELREVLADGSIWMRVGSGWSQVGGMSHQQIDGTDSNAFLTTQWGMGKISATAVSSITEAVTFPHPFAGIPFTHTDYIGGRATAAWNPAGLVDVAPPTNGKGIAPSATGLTVVMHRTDGANMSNGFDYYYSWSATGVLA